MVALTALGADWVSGVGSVEAVELRVAGEGADPVRALRGRFTLVTLGGPSSGPVGVVLSRATDSGLELVGGELVRARSLGVTLSTSGAGDPVARPARVATAPARTPDPPPAAAEDRSQAAASGWAADAAAAARRLRAAERDDTQVLPEPGDLVKHFAFGLCEVLMAEDDRLKIRDLDGPGRIREIRTDMLIVRGPTDQGGRSLFQLERKL
jgi:hypothetical protein